VLEPLQLLHHSDGARRSRSMPSEQVLEQVRTLARNYAEIV